MGIVDIKGDIIDRKILHNYIHNVDNDIKKMTGW